jgi:hypothetical protein
MRYAIALALVLYPQDDATYTVRFAVGGTS